MFPEVPASYVSSVYVPYLNVAKVAKATKNPLPFDFVTSVILHLAKLGLVNLNSCSRSAYWPPMMIHDSVGTNLTAIVIPIYHRFC